MADGFFEGLGVFSETAFNIMLAILRPVRRWRLVNPLTTRPSTHWSVPPQPWSVRWRCSSWLSGLGCWGSGRQLVWLS
eukprot:8831469-Lingulodinium_polyedra.AAC.1